MAENLLLSCECLSTISHPLAGSHFTPSSQCVGETAGGEDFEAFIGAAKAKEFKALFSSWIHKIYRTS